MPELPASPRIVCTNDDRRPNGPAPRQPTTTSWVRAALFANLQIRADQALAHAESQINWAIERAEVAIDGAHLAVGSYADTAVTLLMKTIDEAEAYAAGMKLAASEQFAFLENTAQAVAEAFVVSHFAAMQQFDWNAEHRDELFVGTCIDRAATYSLDVLQETISELEIAVALHPPVLVKLIERGCHFILGAVGVTKSLELVICRLKIFAL